MPAKVKLYVERNGIYEKPAFYSVEYPFDDAPAVRAFLRKKEAYDLWVKKLYDKVRAGLPIEELPRFPEECIEKRYRGKGNETFSEEE